MNKKHTLHIRCILVLVVVLFTFGAMAEAPPTPSKTVVLDDPMPDIFNTKDEESNELYYFLAGILYIDNTKWTAWLNDQSYKNNVDIPGIKILAVEANRIQVQSLKRKGATPQWVSLNQTYCPETNEVLPGDQRRHVLP